MGNIEHRLANRWILFFSGLGQTEKFHAGIRRLEDTVFGYCVSPLTRIELHGWQVDINYLADRISDRDLNHGQADIYLVSYSWGGATANLLALELQKRGIKVRLIAFCDAIARGTIPWLSIKSLRGPSTNLVVPTNVDEVIIWRQITKGITNLKGSKIETSKQTRVLEEVVLDRVLHIYMDEQRGFQESVLKHFYPSKNLVN